MAFGYGTPKEAQEVVEQGFGVHDESADNAAVRGAHICGPFADRRLTPLQPRFAGGGGGREAAGDGPGRGDRPQHAAAARGLLRRTNQIQQSERECWYSYMMSAFSIC